MSHDLEHRKDTPHLSYERYKFEDIRYAKKHYELLFQLNTCIWKPVQVVICYIFVYDEKLY